MQIFIFIEYEQWHELSPSEKESFILYVLEKLEVVNILEQRNAAQSLLYLVQGRLFYYLYKGL